MPARRRHQGSTARADTRYKHDRRRVCATPRLRKRNTRQWAKLRDPTPEACADPGKRRNATYPPTHKSKSCKGDDTKATNYTRQSDETPPPLKQTVHKASATLQKDLPEPPSGMQHETSITYNFTSGEHDS